MLKHIFISTGEVSGDIHGSHLARELLTLKPDLKISGFGSLEMKKEGVEVLKDISHYSAVGLIENIPALFESLNTYTLAKNFFQKEKPDLIVLIDNQGFNLKLADLANKLKIPVYYYIAPQEWIWGFKKGTERVIKKVDKIFAIFKKEFQFYEKQTDKVEYIGHPLLDIVKKEDKNKVRKALGFNNTDLIMGIMPGSRKNEIINLLPVFLTTTKELYAKNSEIKVLLIINELWLDFIKNNFEVSHLKIVSSNSTYYMQSCDLLLAASGTVTLEAVILKLPIIACYKLTKVSYFLAKALIKLDYFTLPNIIANQKVIGEFIQDEVNPEKLTSEILPLLTQQEVRAEMLEKFDLIEKELEPRGSIKKLASLIVKDF